MVLSITSDIAKTNMGDMLPMHRNKFVHVEITYNHTVWEIFTSQ